MCLISTTQFRRRPPSLDAPGRYSRQAPAHEQQAVGAHSGGSVGTACYRHQPPGKVVQLLGAALFIAVAVAQAPVRTPPPTPRLIQHYANEC